MKTQVIIMSREFEGKQIPQRTKDKFFFATDLLTLHQELNLHSKKLMADFFQNQNTKDFLVALAKELDNEQISKYGKSHVITKATLPENLYEIKRGKNGGTWMHPYLFVKFAMWLSPEFEVKIVKWAYDNLAEYRDTCGDNFKEMNDALKQSYLRISNKEPNTFDYINECKFLNRLVFGIHVPEFRNQATENQLFILNRLQTLNKELLEEDVDKNKRYVKLADIADMLHKSFK
jgi:KilA-N domain